MNRALIVLIAGLAITACGKKGAAPEAAADPEAGAITAEMPPGKDAMSFAGKLVQTTVVDWEPVSSTSGAKFVYNQLTFLGTGRWAANGYLEASFEKIECKEAGTWKIEQVTDGRTATMLWVVDKTNCPTREAGTELRVQMVIPEEGKYKINFR
jgi:predicted small lipoprotein YifL